LSNYTKSTNFATKDNLTPGDPLKIVRGTEIDTEFNNIATAIATKTDNASAAVTGGTINDTTIGATTASTGAFTTLAASGNVTLSGGTANGVAYLNGSKVVTSGSALVFDGTNLGVGTSSPAYKLDVRGVLGSGNGTITSGFSYDTGGLVGTFSNHALGVLTNGNVVAKFDTSGNLGLGVTPNAWGSGIKAIDASIGASFYGSSNDTGVVANAYYDGSNWKYRASTASARYQQFIGTGAHAWYTAPSGTAGNAITFTQAMTLDASGNLALGTTTSKATALSGSGNGITIGGAVSPNLVLWDTDNAAYLSVFAQQGTDTVFGNLAAGPLRFYTDSAERARIDSSGNLMVNTTSDIGGLGGKVQIASGASRGLVQSINANTRLQEYLVSGSTVGFISTDGTNTTYSTSSDYRLKNTIAPMTGALAKVALLKPCTYKWNADGSDGQGFIAHELAEVVPQCVTGEKDAVNEDGNPQYQGIDTSFLVATLTAALQEAHGLIKNLETRISALEAK